LTGVAQGLNPREQSGNPEKHRDIEASGFGKSGIPWTRDRQIHRGNPDELRAVHLLGQVAGTRSHRYIGGSEVKSPRPFEFRNSEGIIAVDLKKDTCRVITQPGIRSSGLI
jgi:hypothetical protein